MWPDSGKSARIEGLKCLSVEDRLVHQLKCKAMEEAGTDIKRYIETPNFEIVVNGTSVLGKGL
jgi:hypothetical protein